MENAPNVVLRLEYAMTQDEIASRRMSDAKKSKYSRERNFYGCTQADDYVRYVDRGIAEGDIVYYSGNPEKSSGIFNANGLLDKKDRAVLRKNLRETQSVIWHGVISFEEAFGEKHIKSHEDAMELLRIEMPVFFRRIGLNTENTEWFAGLHENTDNKHIHFAFFEKSPSFHTAKDKETLRYRYGKIRQEAFDMFKVRIEERLTDVSFCLKQNRRALTSTNKQSLKDSLNGLSDFDRALRKKLLELYRAMPTEGRVGYNTLNMAPLRGQVKDIVNFIVKANPAVKREFDRFTSDCAAHDDNVKAICARQKIKNPTDYLKEDTYIEDVYRRLGDQVIQAALAIKRKEARERKLCKSDLAKKRVEKRHRKYLFERSERLCREVDDEAVRCFEEFRRKLDEAEYARLVDEGVIEAE